jgi:hypothetical protein
MLKPKERKYIIPQLILFLFVLVYFTEVTPLVPFDADDWLFSGAMRLPFPIWHSFNPTRVTPEILQPLAGYLGAFCIYPFTKNYVGALSFAHSFVLTTCITITFYLFFKLLIRRLGYSFKRAIVTEAFFFMSFFLLFVKLHEPSYTGFWTPNITYAYFYIISGLLNASLVFIMMQSSDFLKTFKKYSTTQKGLFLLALYFALFSNTQFNIIVATFSFCALVKFVRSLDNFKISKLTEGWPYFLILAVWLLSVFFDLHGQRAHDVSNMMRGSFTDNLYSTLGQFIRLLKLMNKEALILFTFIILAFLLTIFLEKIKRRNTSGIIELNLLSYSISCGILTWLYLILAYSKGGSGYAGSVPAMWSVQFFYLFAVSISLGYFIQNFKVIRCAMPLLLTLIFVISFNLNWQKISVGVDNHAPQTQRAVDNYIINQIVRADRNGKSSVIVKVPLNDKNASSKVSSSNWPQSFQATKYFQNTLYTHHIIRSRIKIRFKPDEKINTRFYENRSDEQPFTPLERD